MLVTNGTSRIKQLLSVLYHYECYVCKGSVHHVTLTQEGQSSKLNVCKGSPVVIIKLLIELLANKFYYPFLSFKVW